MRTAATAFLVVAVAIASTACQRDPAPAGAERDDVAAEPPAAADAAVVHEGLMAHDAWSRPLAPGATVAAGYMHLMNHGGQPETLVSASAEGVGRVEIHEIAEVDGVKQMRPVEGGLALAVDGSATLQPGGTHLMFFDVARSWSAGEIVPVTLEFAGGRTLVVDVAVRDGDAPAAAHDHHAH